jgi:preprotein translocase SecE subunit
VAENRPSRKKRRLRAPSETVREKGTKAQQAATQPKKRGKISAFWRGIFWPFRQIGKGLAWVSHRPPLKQIGHGLRWFFSLKPVKFIGKIIGVNFVVTSFSELRGVSWPSRTEARRLTTAVIIFSVIFGALIAGVDYGLDKLFKQVILKG